MAAFFPPKIPSVPGRQCEQTLLLYDSASSVLPSVTFCRWKINKKNGTVIKTTAQSLSYEIITIIFKMAQINFAAPLANFSL